MNQLTSSIHMTGNSFSRASFFFFSPNIQRLTYLEPFISSCASTASIFLIEKTLIERTTCKVSSPDCPSRLPLVFHLDSIIPSLFIIYLSFSFSFFSFFFWERDVASLCGSIKFGGKYFIILGTQSLTSTGLFLFSLFMDYYEIA